MTNPNPARESKLRISLARWTEIVLIKHGLSPQATGDAWRTIPDSTLDAIIADIQAVTGSVSPCHPVTPSP